MWFNYTDIEVYLINTVPELPGFHSSVKPDVDDITSSSATVSWPRATNVSAGLEDHYHYLLWLQADGKREKNVTRVEQGAGEQRVEAQITGLTFNKKYSLRVEPYRELNGERHVSNHNRANGCSCANSFPRHFPQQAPYFQVFFVNATNKSDVYTFILISRLLWYDYC